MVLAGGGNVRVGGIGRPAPQSFRASLPGQERDYGNCAHDAGDNARSLHDVVVPQDYPEGMGGTFSPNQLFLGAPVRSAP
jgi:hypothetical protein